MQELQAKIRREDHSFRRNADGQLIPIITDQLLHPPTFFKIGNVAAKNRVEQVFYVLGVVAVKLVNMHSVVQM